MGIWKRLVPRRPTKRPALDVMEELSGRVVNLATRHAIDCVTSLRAAGFTVAPYDTQIVLDEFYFVALHFVDRAANAMLTQRTQDLFLPAFAASTLWMRAKDQDPELSDEAAELAGNVLMRRFGRVNGGYASSTMGTPVDATTLADSLPYRFGLRIAEAAQLDATGPVLILCMGQLVGLIPALNPEELLAQLV